MTFNQAIEFMQARWLKQEAEAMQTECDAMGNKPFWFKIGSKCWYCLDVADWIKAKNEAESMGYRVRNELFYASDNSKDITCESLVRLGYSPVVMETGFAIFERTTEGGKKMMYWENVKSEAV